ncbi:hypothetical protein PHJA_001200900 [Phtheirospermum japonicum]|uniref:Uncharacterized protein n=1 Tax=Phtheirospermum japonicum TaxID=374723 RepID=A0A830C024_9LAMI|nr:hypothetical protein PHJA_001200900 [Phtheirospermum japonicum]
MNKSAVFSRYETADYHDFDYQADFTQFLEEAKKTAHQETINTAQVEAHGEKQLNNSVKKSRTSWKKSLFSWLKIDKKSENSDQQLTNVKKVLKPKRGHVSGPVQGNVAEVITKSRSHKPASGPLTGLFGSAKGADEYKVPYMCLGQINDPHKLQSYGPVYLVT